MRDFERFRSPSGVRRDEPLDLTRRVRFVEDKVAVLLRQGKQRYREERGTKRK